MKVLVTGGAGYIGSVLVPKLIEQGHDVTVLDRFFFGTVSLAGLEPRVRLIKEDIRTCDSAIFRGIDAVLDLASLSNDPSGELDPRKTLEINYKGRVRIAKIALERQVKQYILASTCSVYGSSSETSSETSALNPLTTYAKANALAEQDILGLGGSGFCRTVLRQATVYGLSKRMRFDLAVNGMTLSYYSKRKISIMRDGNQWRPFVHVADTSDAFLKVLEADKSLVDGEIFNVGSDAQNFQVLALAETVAEAMGGDLDLEWYGSPDKRNYKVSFGKIKRLNFKPNFTPAAGAREIQAALANGTLNGDDPRCITVNWYKRLLATPELSREVALNGTVL